MHLTMATNVTLHITSMNQFAPLLMCVQRIFKHLHVHVYMCTIQEAYNILLLYDLNHYLVLWR